VKIAGRDGSSDVSKVLAAIQWVVSFRAEYGIRVLNLSLGTNSTQTYKYDPLNHAVERAWQAGIVVVVAASNRGPDPGTISKPADDPLVLTVGAVDDRGTKTVDDDRLPDFSGRGPTVTDGIAKPDVASPGAAVVSLRSPGSFIEEKAPPGELAGTAYRRGSGTSMATAITSGATALLLQARPEWTPDRVKFAFGNTAQLAAARDPAGVGAGVIDAYGATYYAPPGLANEDVRTLSDSTGALDASRGSVQVTFGQCMTATIIDPQCVVVQGQQTAQGRLFDAQRFAQETWDGSSWYTSQWSGSSWYGSSWYGSSWYGSSWYGSSWYGGSDADTSYGVPVVGSLWYGAWR
jgi:serine protease AprX